MLEARQRYDCGEPSADRDDFNARGYVVRRNMFTPGEMHHFIAAVRETEDLRGGTESLDEGTMQFYSNIFKESETVRRFITHPAIIDFMVPIVGPDMWVRWDQAVKKGPRSGVFPWHQDNGYNQLPTEHFQLWIALSEMTMDNGGLWIVAGSHKRLLPHTRVGRHMEAIGSRIYDEPAATKTFISAAAGDVVLFSSRALHKTYENVTDRPRWAYVAEFMRSSDYDPTLRRPYFNAARDGKPYPAFTATLPGCRDMGQRVRTLPLAMRHYYERGSWRLKRMLARGGD
ncbi:MAG: hypothetical protein JWL84_1500 [Rhodospirillales bacterium]|jgi:ectoine hydroxylase-related dioxygenase (phytanoyl-CoA dioxygenase family)|nr:hypothetical protein [Rhodospirillales bacterium]